MNVLILGGTTFFGRHLARMLVERSHTVSLFTRGISAYDESLACTRYVGDRDGDLGALPRTGWDAVVDTSGYVPGIVAASCAHLAHAGRYVFTSSISVYDASGAVIGDGLSPYVPRVANLADDAPENYGPSKRGAEDVVRAVFDDRAIVIRPGLLVGPHDPTNRFTYWADRFAEGGEIAIPGPPDRFVQCIDIRDAAAFVIHVLEDERSGTYDLSGKPQTTTMGELATIARATFDVDARLTWIDESFLEARGFTGWMDLPLWIGPSHGFPGFMNANVDRALEHGLTLRPFAQTLADTRAWSQRSGPVVPSETIAGISRERERDLLAAWQNDRNSKPN